VSVTASRSPSKFARSNFTSRCNLVAAPQSTATYRSSLAADGLPLDPRLTQALSTIPNNPVLSQLVTAPVDGKMDLLDSKSI